MKAAGFEFPDELHYHVEHQVWARLNPDGTARVGVTAMGAHLAGDLYMCRPKPPGAAVEQGRGIAVVELAKSIVSVKSPVSGTVLRVNERLAQEPELVNRHPYDEGWIAELQLPADAAAELSALVQGEAVMPAMEHHAWLMKAED